MRGLAFALAALTLLLALSGTSCLGDAPSGGGAGADAGATVPDAGPPDLTRLPVEFGALPDLLPSDLAGFVACFGVTFCDRAQELCVRYHAGSQANPGALLGAPACFGPTEPCGTIGQQMDCGCIQNDNTLGSRCQGACQDNMDGTFDCFDQP